MARPLYYGMQMFRAMVRDAGLVSASIVSPDLNLAAFATKAVDGTLRVCLINKELERGVHVQVDVRRKYESVSALWLGAPSAAATSGVTLGSSALDDFGRWSPRPPEAVPLRGQSLVEMSAASAVMLQFTGM